MITIALAQYDFLVGDIRGNLGKAQGLIAQARSAGADLVLFPEMALTGYPPEDLLLRPGFLKAVRHAVHELTESVQGIDVVIGHPWEEQVSATTQSAGFAMASWPVVISSNCYPITRCSMSGVILFPDLRRWYLN